MYFGVADVFVTMFFSFPDTLLFFACLLFHVFNMKKGFGHYKM